MGAYRFSMAPNISVPRSKFHMPFNHITSFNHGKLIPIDCFEILPGDEFKLDMSAIIRMSTPIAPIFGNIKGHVHAFFVPMRLVWEHTKEFYGENKTSAGYQTYNYLIPRSNFKQNTNVNLKNAPTVGSVSHYLGKPLNITLTNNAVKANVLKERCYYLIWNEYYRAQQIQNPVLLNVSDTPIVGSLSNGNSDYSSSSTTIAWDTLPMNVCKEFDYFTACTRAPQYGSSVALPLGTYAPIVPYANSTLSPSTNYEILRFPTSNVPAGSYGTSTDVWASSSASAKAATLYADLSNATAASINTIRYAFACQKWLERANFGSRFFEMLNLHYGVTSPDARLQRPEYLGGRDFYINVDQVLSTAGYDDSSATLVGQPGAVSVTGVKANNLFHKAFVEPGYVMILLSTTHERSYAQGLLREDLRSERFDFYFPEFANLGDQAVSSCELYFANDTLANEEIPFGYQEHWAEYRYRPNRVSGIMDPNYASGLDFWTLAEAFPSRPTLSDSFIMENRDCLERCLVTGSSGPDYIADIYFDYTAVREMPLYTIPGLIDHFGTM